VRLGQSGLPELEDDECTLQSSLDVWSLLLTLRFFMRLLTRGASIGEKWMAALLRRREIFAQIDFARMRRVIRIGLFVTFCWVLSGNTAAAQQSSAAVETKPDKPGTTQFGLIVFPATLLANVFGYVNLANLLETALSEALMLRPPVRCPANRRRFNHYSARGATACLNARRSPPSAYASAAYLRRYGILSFFVLVEFNSELFQAA
jgi:hypothetical protein